MSSAKQLKAMARGRVGKGAAREDRRQGRLPAVIYGSGEAPVAITLDFNELKHTIYAGGFLTTVFEIDVDGQKTRVIPRDYQLDPIKDFPVHIDFLRISRDAKVEVDVPLHFDNAETAPGIKNGGTLNIVHHTIALRVASDAIPDAVTVDVGALEIGDSLHVDAVKLPAGAELVVHERDFTVVTIVPPTVDAADEAPAASE